MQPILSKREETIVYVIIGLIIFSVALNFIISPILAKNEELNKETEVTKGKLKRYLWLLSKKESIQDKYNKFSLNLESKISVQATSVSTLAHMENLAKEANLHIVDIRLQAPRKAGSHTENIVDLRTEANMESYFKFIYSIENSLLLLRIKSFQLNAKPNNQFLEGIFTITQTSLD